MTHTYVVLDVSLATYQEIYTLLEAASYHHTFHERADDTVIDMHGIALRAIAESAAESVS